MKQQRKGRAKKKQQNRKWESNNRIMKHGFNEDGYKKWINDLHFTAFEDIEEDCFDYLFLFAS